MVLLSQCWRVSRWLAACPLAFWVAQASDAPSALDSPPTIIAQPALLAFASSHGIPVEGMELTPGRATGKAGDSITALVTLREGVRQRQWLVEFSIGTLTEQERASMLHGVISIGIGNGQSIKFSADASTALEIRVAGPFLANHNPPEVETRARALISPDFLSLGLDSFGRINVEARRRMGAAKAGGGLPPKPVADLNQLSNEDQRAFIGFFTALTAFVQGIQSTPGLRDILWEIAEKPSIWSLVKGGGKIDIGISVVDGVAAVDSADWSLPPVVFYRVPLQLTFNRHPLLACVLFATSPRPPLLATAGIVGIVARPPGKEDKRLDIRVIAARLGPTMP